VNGAAHPEKTKTVPRPAALPRLLVPVLATTLLLLEYRSYD